ANNEESEARMRRDVTYLASDECEGRGPGTKGIDKAADYIAGEFKKAGLKPGGTAGYFQPFTIFEGARQDGPATLKLRGPLGQEITLRAGTDFQVLGSSGKGNVDAPVVFVGYGVTAPGIGYDDYKGIDVAGKVVMLLRHTPRWENDDVPFDGDLREEHALLVTKQSLAEAHRAAAIVLVNDAADVTEGDKLMNFGDGRGSSPGNVPFVHMKRAFLEAMLRAGTESGLRDVERAIDRDLQ